MRNNNIAMATAQCCHGNLLLLCVSCTFGWCRDWYVVCYGVGDSGATFEFTGSARLTLWQKKNCCDGCWKYTPLLETHRVRTSEFKIVKKKASSQESRTISRWSFEENNKKKDCGRICLALNELDKRCVHRLLRENEEMFFCFSSSWWPYYRLPTQVGKKFFLPKQMQ